MIRPGSSPSCPGKSGSRRGTPAGLGACGRCSHGLFIQMMLASPAANLRLLKGAKAFLSPAVTDPNQHGVDQFHHPPLIPEMRNELGSPPLFLNGAFRQVGS